ncbi:MAG: DUF2974 domain-containing protein [Treponema sp.]|jgi:hypothetical protein|nr:DUF2974 domain-containing protein [Treponema sp.]
MANLFDYLLWRGDLTFNKSPFNPVDNIILSQLSYLPLDGIVPGLDEKDGISIAQAAAIFIQRMANNTLQSQVMFEADPSLIDTLGRTDRFKNCILHSYVNHMDVVREKQFAALCIDTGDFTFVAYRGTDGSVVGWKEDFNMSFSAVVPAQLEAVSYLEKIAKKVRGPLFPGGHSKGGNLAIYAASSCAKRLQHRIAGIYSNDAPGFHRQFIESAGYQKMCQRIHSFVPQTSIVGMLFEHGKDHTVIKSSQTGILQHELYSWEVAHNDMVHLDSIDQGSRFVDKTLREWIGSLDNEHLRQFSETLFGILNDAEIKSLSEDGADWPKAAVRMIQSLGNIDRDTRKNIRRMLAALFTAAKDNIDMLLQPDDENGDSGSGGN